MSDLDKLLDNSGLETYDPYNDQNNDQNNDIFDDYSNDKIDGMYSNIISGTTIFFTSINILLPFYYKRIVKIDHCTTILFGLLFVLSFISILLTPLVSKLYFTKKNIIKYRDVSVAMSATILVFNILCIYLLNILGDKTNSMSIQYDTNPI